MLENHHKFPTYFQLLPSITELVNGIAGLVNWFNWKKVALFVQQDEFFTTVSIIVMLCMYMCAVHVPLLGLNILIQQGERIKLLLQSTSVNFSEHFLMPNRTVEVKVVYIIITNLFGMTDV